MKNKLESRKETRIKIKYCAKSEDVLKVHDIILNKSQCDLILLARTGKGTSLF